MPIVGLRYRLQAHNGNLARASDSSMLLPHQEYLPTSWVRFILDVYQPFVPFQTRNQQTASLERLKALVSEKCGEYIITDLRIAEASRNRLTIEVSWRNKASGLTVSDQVGVVL